MFAVPDAALAIDSESTLTPVQQEVINQLASGLSLFDAAQAARIHRNTIANWRRAIPAFAQELERATRERAQVFQEQIHGLVPDAIRVLSTILNNEKASPSVRLRAALTVMKIASAKPQPVTEPAPETNTEKAEIVHNSAQQPVRRAVEPGRNALCPCGSNLKFKRCCANKSPLALPQTTSCLELPHAAGSSAAGSI